MYSIKKASEEFCLPCKIYSLRFIYEEYLLIINILFIPPMICIIMGHTKVKTMSE